MMALQGWEIVILLALIVFLLAVPLLVIVLVVTLARRGRVSPDGPSVVPPPASTQSVDQHSIQTTVL